MKGPLLFKYICEQDEFTETDVRSYFQQLLSALDWLHRNNIAHLDVKVNQPDLKRKLSKQNNLFAAWECYGGPIGLDSPPQTYRLWRLCQHLQERYTTTCLSRICSSRTRFGSASGKTHRLLGCRCLPLCLAQWRSPFLDDSVEETTANILKCDFCFPEEYFGAVSEEAKELIRCLLILTPLQRMDMQQCLDHRWTKEVNIRITLMFETLQHVQIIWHILL